MDSLSWVNVETLIRQLITSGGDIHNLPDQIESFWRVLNTSGHSEEIMRFGFLISDLNDGRGERWGMFELLCNINMCVARTAELEAEYVIAGRFWHDQGQMLHRKGLIIEAIEAFIHSSSNYSKAKKEFQEIESVFMTAICYRALGEVQKAKAILAEILKTVDIISWRANPLIVLAWLERDSGNLSAAKELLIEAIPLLKQEINNSHYLVLAQTLTDLGQLNTSMGLLEEAEQNFVESISHFKSLTPVDYRQLARSYIKMSRLMRKRRDLEKWDKYLNEARAILETTEHYELAMHVQVEFSIFAVYQHDLSQALRYLRWAWLYSGNLGLSRRRLIKIRVIRVIKRIGLSLLHRIRGRW